MRILAIDHGSKRIGLAVSDELKTIAQPLTFVPAEPPAKLFDQLRRIVVEQDVELVLVGMPRNMDGSYGPAAEKVRAFVAQLREAVDRPVRTWDERLTSVQANRLLQQGGVKGARRKEKVDKMAAAILLQSYLDAIA